MTGIVRNADGSLDTSFSDDGKLILPVGTGGDLPTALSNKPMVNCLSGRSDNGSNTDYSIVRLTADGSLDTSFSDDGKLILPVGTMTKPIALSNKPMVNWSWQASYNENRDYSIVRLTADGSLDTSFSDDGKLILPVGTVMTML